MLTPGPGPLSVRQQNKARRIARREGHPQPPVRQARGATVIPHSLVHRPVPAAPGVPTRDDAWFGYPGPAYPPADGEPLRVLYHTRVARGEGTECYAAYLAGGMPDGAVEWYYTVEEGDPEEDGQLLREFGEVKFLAEKGLAWWDFLRAVLDFRPHVIHTSTQQGAQFAAAVGIPCVATVHGVAGFVPASFYGANVAEYSVGVSPQASGETDGCILSGIEPVAWPTTRDQNAVVWLGRLDEDRHPALFLDALVSVPDARAVVIGKANRRDFDVNAEAARRGIGDRVEWLGQLPADEARARAAECGVIVSTVNESFGFGTAEAMSAGVRPVVIEGPGYQVDMAKGWGCVCAPTADALAKGLRATLANPWTEMQRQDMADAVTARYDARRMADEYRAAYQSLLVEPIDIVILARDELAVTRDCLMHVLANTWLPYHLVLVDNASEEPVADLFRQFAALVGEDRCLILEPGENLGGPGGRQLAYAHCDAEFFAWLDNDMLVSPGWLGRLFTRMRADESIGFIGPWSAIYPVHIRGQAARVTDMTGSNNLWRTEAVRAAEEVPGQIHTEPFATLQGRADTDLACRVKEAGYGIWSDGQVELLHLGGPLRKGLVQGMTRRRGDTAGMTGAQEHYKAKWRALGVRR